MAIHPTAIIDPKAELDSTVDVGPYTIIEGPVKIGPRTRIRAHAHLSGWVELGEDCDIFPFAVLGSQPQDFHFKGERSYCRLGNRVILREGASVHRGSGEESVTLVGDDSVLLSYAHVGHNCQLGRGAQIQHAALVAGHVQVQDRAIVGAGSLIHQFVRIGHLAFIAAGARVSMDVPPFFTCQGESTLVQHNRVGMSRAGYSAAEIFEIRQAFRSLYRSAMLFRAAVDKLAETVRTDAGRKLVAFLKSESQRGFCTAGSHRIRTARSAKTDELQVSDRDQGSA
jgi:UDP-N-acetylglucosamine acyltransferase